MTCGIYQILHTESQKRYIGSSKNISKRLSHHKWSLKNKKHYNDYLQKIYNKYGAEAFEFSVLIERINKWNKEHPEPWNKEKAAMLGVNKP